MPVKQPAKPSTQIIADDVIHRNDDSMSQRKNVQELFVDYPDLLARIKANPDSWNTFTDALYEKINRDSSVQDTKKKLADAKRDERIRVAGELTEVGSKDYHELLQTIDNEKEFYKHIANSTVLKHTSVKKYNKKLQDDYEFRMLLAKKVKFEFQPDIERFVLQINNEDVSFIRLSDQVAYVLGYEDGKTLKSGDIARYPPDLRGDYLYFIAQTINCFRCISSLRLSQQWNNR
jgi:uncharacterized protein with von Willebrand factor type A (vWA) domain